MLGDLMVLAVMIFLKEEAGNDVLWGGLGNDDLTGGMVE